MYNKKWNGNNIGKLKNARVRCIETLECIILAQQKNKYTEDKAKINEMNLADSNESNLKIYKNIETMR